MRPQKKILYTTSVENSKKFLAKSGLTWRFREKTFKVSGVSEAFNKGISMEDAMFHGR